MRPETRHSKGRGASSATNCESNDEVQEEHTDGEVQERPNGDEVPEKHPDADATEHDGAPTDVSSGHPADPNRTRPHKPATSPGPSGEGASKADTHGNPQAVLTLTQMQSLVTTAVTDVVQALLHNREEPRTKSRPAQPKKAPAPDVPDEMGTLLRRSNRGNRRQLVVDSSDSESSDTEELPDDDDTLDDFLDDTLRARDYEPPPWGQASTIHWERVLEGMVQPFPRCCCTKEVGQGDPTGWASPKAAGTDRRICVRPTTEIYPQELQAFDAGTGQSVPCHRELQNLWGTVQSSWPKAGREHWRICGWTKATIWQGPWWKGQEDSHRGSLEEVLGWIAGWPGKFPGGIYQGPRRYWLGSPGPSGFPGDPKTLQINDWETG